MGWSLTCRSFHAQRAIGCRVGSSCGLKANLCKQAWVCMRVLIFYTTTSTGETYWRNFTSPRTSRNNRVKEKRNARIREMKAARGKRSHRISEKLTKRITLTHTGYHTNHIQTHRKRGCFVHRYLCCLIWGLKHPWFLIENANST